MSGPGILERDAELGALRGRVSELRHGVGGVVLVEGAAGIGKTVLLDEARDAARDAGAVVLSATAVELEREFPFGVVHQLLDPVLARADDQLRDRLLAGAAGRAEHVLRPETADPDAPSDLGYAVLHGLYWLCVNLADEAPLVLVLDDLHWADHPSLRLLEFLGRRLDGVPLLVVGALRPREPGTDEALLAAITAGPSCTVLRPAPLSLGGVDALLRDGLGAAPDPAFAAACEAATGGNPLLLRALVREAAERGLTGTADEAHAATEAASVGLARSVERRLATLGSSAVELVRAAAVLGPRRGVDDLAAVARLSRGDAIVAADRLVAAGLLDADGWDFVHPLVRSAVHGAIPPAARQALHARTTARLREHGARPTELAVHHLASAPAGDPRTVADLRAAAAVATAEGAPRTAVEHLRRALLEPVPDADRATVLLELGELEVRIGDGHALDRLAQALDAGLTGDGAARAHAARGERLLGIDPAAGVADLRRAAEGARDPALRLRLEALLLEATAYDSTLTEEHAALLRAGEAAADPSSAMLAHLAIRSAYEARPVAETLALADRALRDARVLETLGPQSATFHLVALALRHAEHPARARRLIDEAAAIAGRRGSLGALLFTEHADAYWHWTFGSLGAAEARARRALEEARRAGMAISVAASAAVLVEILVERDDLDGAAALLPDLARDTDWEARVSGPDLASAAAAAHLARGDAASAERELRRGRAMLARRGWRAPFKGRCGIRLGTLLGAAGRTEEALAVLDAEAAVAREAGLAGALGAILRVRGRVLGGDAGIATATQAVETLRGTDLVLERGWALHDLGALLRREGRPADAREPLREALDVAAERDAVLLARTARDELVAAGARPRRTALRGPASLTPSERRVAELAASGLMNRQIAETLWVSRKTVEVHLGNAYAKLGIRGRTQLADALGGETADDPR